MTPLDRSRLIARVFSRPVLDGMARHGLATDIAKKLSTLGVEPGKSLQTVGDVFDAGLDEISRSYRCEYVYKSAIASRIVFGRHSPRTSSLAIELGADGSIVDAAVFNGTATAYEIKTEFDSPTRLTTQTPSYLRAFDRVYVVTHPDCAERYRAALDPRVGVLALNLDNSLSTVRMAEGDISRVEPEVVFRMLRRLEYMKVVHQHFGPQPALPNGLIDAHYRSLFRQLTSSHAHTALVAAMRARTTDADSVAFLSALPKSLRALGYATPLSGPQRQRVLASLAAPA
jgi:hypothetical protein